MLSSWSLYLPDAEEELRTVRSWLRAHAEFGEAEVVQVLRRLPNLCLLIHASIGKGTPNRLHWEFAIEGTFRADLVIGSSVHGDFVLIEFEDGRRDSLFKARRRDAARLRSWSSRLEHAMGQIADWSWAKSQRSIFYATAFGGREVTETYLIVCGRREPAMDPISLDRLNWRCHKTQIATCSVRIWTYDDLLANMEASVLFLQELVEQSMTKPHRIAPSIP